MLLYYSVVHIRPRLCYVKKVYLHVVSDKNMFGFLKIHIFNELFMYIVYICIYLSEYKIRNVFYETPCTST